MQSRMSLWDDPRADGCDLQGDEGEGEAREETETKKSGNCHSLL